MIVVDHISIDLGTLDLRRALGYPKNQDFKDEMRERVEALVRTAQELISPRAVYTFFPKDALPAGVPLRSSPLVALAVCTIGSEVEQRSKAFFDQTRMLDAFILDALGSEAAEATAQQVDERIALDPRASALHPGCRISPGYPPWDLASQKEVFEVIPAREIGVTLTDSMMMIPRKSVSFALPFDAEPATGRDKGTCSRCGLDTCPYRKEKP